MFRRHAVRTALIAALVLSAMAPAVQAERATPGTPVTPIPPEGLGPQGSLPARAVLTGPCPPQRLVLAQAGEMVVKVPPGCTHLAFKLWGGGGGAGEPYDHAYHGGQPRRGGHGGGGGFVTVEGMTVTPGDSLRAMVGCGGTGQDATFTQACSAACGVDRQIQAEYYRQRQRAFLPIRELIADDSFGEGGSGGMYTALLYGEATLLAVAAGGGGGGAGALHGDGMDGLPANQPQTTQPYPPRAGEVGYGALTTADGKGGFPTDFPWHSGSEGKAGSRHCGGAPGEMYGYSGGGGMGGCGFHSGGGGAAGAATCRMEEVCIDNLAWSARQERVRVPMEQCGREEEERRRCVDARRFRQNRTVVEVDPALCANPPSHQRDWYGYWVDHRLVDFYTCASGPGGGGGGGYNQISVYTNSRTHRGGLGRVPGGTEDPDWGGTAGIGGEATAAAGGPGAPGRAVLIFYVQAPQ